MKLNEFLNESDIDDIAEAPAGMVGQMARKAGAKVLNKIGMKGKAGELATKANVGDEANRIKQELRQFMAGSGIKKGGLEVNDFLAFLANAGFDKNTAMKVIRKHVPKKKPEPNPATLVASVDNEVNEAIAPQIIDKVIMDLVTLGFKKQAGGKQVRSKYAIDNKKGNAQAMNKFKAATGMKNPAMAAQALAKAAQGETLSQNERKAIAPLLQKLAGSMTDQAGQQRILQLFRQQK